MFENNKPDPNYRYCHLKVILDIFEYQSGNIVLKTITQKTFQEKISTATYFLIHYMLLLSYKRNILLLKN